MLFFVYFLLIIVLLLLLTNKVEYINSEYICRHFDSTHFSECYVIDCGIDLKEAGPLQRTTQRSVSPNFQKLTL